jgi:hypothetical protein
LSLNCCDPLATFKGLCLENEERGIIKEIAHYRLKIITFDHLKVDFAS